MKNYNTWEGYFAPDGFYADGRSKPWRSIIIMEVRGNIAHYIYSDTGAKGMTPCYSLRYRHESEAG